MKKYTLGIYEKAMPLDLSWKEKLESAKKAGYDFLEVSIDETEEKLSRLDWGREERLNIVEMMYDTGIPIRSMCLSGHRKYPIGSLCKETADRGMEIMEKALQLADDLGIRLIQLAGYDVYYEEGNKETRKRFEQNLEKATEMAAGLGIMLGFETMETEFMNTVEKSMKYVKLNYSPYLNVYPDCGNITNAAISCGKNALDDLQSGKGHLVAMHLKETKSGVFRNMFYGQGHVDFESMIAKAWKLGVRRYVAEFWYLGSENWKQNLEQANKTMRKILDSQ